MSRTKHHNSPKKASLVKLPDRYTGWLGECSCKQNGRRFVKKLIHRATRRWDKYKILEELT